MQVHALPVRTQTSRGAALQKCVIITLLFISQSCSHCELVVPAQALAAGRVIFSLEKE